MKEKLRQSTNTLNQSDFKDRIRMQNSVILTDKEEQERQKHRVAQVKKHLTSISMNQMRQIELAEERLRAREAK